jgi:hypothetical protein
MVKSKLGLFVKLFRFENYLSAYLGVETQGHQNFGFRPMPRGFRITPELLFSPSHGPNDRGNAGLYCSPYPHTDRYRSQVTIVSPKEGETMNATEV